MIDDELVRHIIRIQAYATRIDYTQSDDLATDKQLGELEALVYTARQAISDNWSGAQPKHPMPPTSDLLNRLGLGQATKVERRF